MPDNKLLKDKPHQGDMHLKRSESDVRRMRRSVDPVEDEDILSHFNSRFLNRTSNEAPLEMLIAQEKSTKVDPKCDPPNLIAKLMGIDAIPQRKPRPNTQRSHSRIHPQNGYFGYTDPNEYKDVDVIWQQPHKYEDNIIPSPTEKHILKPILQSVGVALNDRKMNLVRQKFIEAKRLSMDEKLHHSKQFQDALDVLSSNRDLFLKCLQEPYPVFSQRLHGTPETRRITVLRPSKAANSNDFSRLQRQQNNLEKTHPTRIVVLKPVHGKLLDAEAAVPLQPHLPKMLLSEDSFGDAEDVNSTESRRVTKSFTRQMRERLGEHRREENLVSSFSCNGYAGDESSFDNSENESEDGYTSDLKAMSPVLTKASYPPEYSIGREAKRRLYERWAMIASNSSCPEQRQFQRRSSSTLGEMIAMLDTKKEGPRWKREENEDCEPRNIMRSKSLPVSSTDKRNPKSPREDVKETSVVSSFRGKVSSLFFSRNNKTGKNKSSVLRTIDEDPSFTGEIISDKTGNLSEKGSDGYSPEPSPTGKQGTTSPEARLAVPQPVASANIGEKQHDQPRPTSAFGSPLDESELTAKPRDQQGVENLFNGIGPSLIDKSSPIGSIPFTRSWEDMNTTVSLPPKPFTAPQKTDGEQDCFSLVKILLSAAALHGKAQSSSFLAKWHSLESPLDPSLRENYIDDSYYTSQEAKQCHYVPIQQLVFDCVNEVLMDIAGYEMDPRRKFTNTDSCVVDLVWARMKAWFQGEEENGGGAHYGVAVEKVVGREAAREGWNRNLRSEVDDLGKEISGVLLEEIVKETVVEFMGRETRESSTR